MCCTTLAGTVYLEFCVTGAPLESCKAMILMECPEGRRDSSFILREMGKLGEKRYKCLNDPFCFCMENNLLGQARMLIRRWKDNPSKN